MKNKFEETMNQVELELDVDLEVAKASEKMEMLELFDKAREKGDEYYQGFNTGFWKALELHEKWTVIDEEIINNKYRSADITLQEK